MDLEDGEVPSSENEEEEPTRPPPVPANSLEFPEFPDETDYVILDRPKSSLPRPTPGAEPSPLLLPAASAGTFGNTNISAYDPPGYLQQAAPNTVPFPSSFVDSLGDEPYGRKQYYAKMNISDLLDSQSSEKDSSDSDSDSDYNSFGKRSRMGLQPPFKNSSNNAAPVGETSYPALFTSGGNASSSAQSSSGDMISALSAFQARASTYQQERKKPNLVWSNVMQEEQISDVFGGVKMDEPSYTNIEVERGPETYFFQRPMRQPRQRRPSDSSDISSEGLSDNALHYLRDGTSYNEEETEESSEHSLPTSFTSRNVSKKAINLKRRRTNPKLKRKVFNKLKKMKSPDLAAYMAKKLIEEKVNLLERAVEILGKDNCIHIFIKTLKIEKRGGLMVKNQVRRRTPGGVFLYLIRGDRRFPKSQIDLIFRDERAFHDRYRKKKAAVGRLNRKAKLEAEKAKCELETGMQDDSDDTAVPWQEQDGTDTGQLGDDSTQESSVHEKDTTAEEASGYSEMQCDGSES